MEFIRELLPFIYTISEWKLFTIITILILITALIFGTCEDAIEHTLAVLLLGVIAFFLANYLLDGITFRDTVATVAFIFLAFITFVFVSVFIKTFTSNRKKKEQVRKREQEKQKLFREKLEQEEQEKLRREAFYTCKECGQKDAIEHVNTTEKDRYITSKEVSERTANGNYQTRYVQCTKVVEEKSYKCKLCGAEFSDSHIRELT